MNTVNEARAQRVTEERVERVTFKMPKGKVIGIDDPSFGGIGSVSVTVEYPVVSVGELFREEGLVRVTDGLSPREASEFAQEMSRRIVVEGLRRTMSIS